MIEEEVGRLLRDKGLTISLAESCTGGLVCHRITNIPGSSEYFVCGIIAYSNESKEEWLLVPPAIIEKFGAVSFQTAEKMAFQVMELSGSDIGMGITGIAGPGGGTHEKPVGLVYVGLATREGIALRKFMFEGDRLQVKEKTSEASLQFLLDFLKAPSIIEFKRFSDPL